MAAIQPAEELNGNMPKAGTVSDLITRYFNWQAGMKPGDLRKKQIPRCRKIYVNRLI